MNEIRKELAAATRQKDRAREAFMLNPNSKELGDRLTAAYARFAAARAAAGGLPPAPLPVPRCSDPNPRHAIEAEMHRKIAEAYRLDMLKARATADKARAAAKRMEARSESYTREELQAAYRRITAAEAAAKRQERGMISATKAEARAMDRAEGKPRQPAAGIDKEAHARRLMRWQRTEQKLERVRDVWQTRLDDAMETYHPDQDSPGARWQQRCRDYLRLAAARLAAYRRDHGLTAPPTPDQLEKDENGEYIL